MTRHTRDVSGQALVKMLSNHYQGHGHDRQNRRADHGQPTSVIDRSGHGVGAAPHDEWQENDRQGGTNRQAETNSRAQNGLLRRRVATSGRAPIPALQQSISEIFVCVWRQIPGRRPRPA